MFGANLYGQGMYGQGYAATSQTFMTIINGLTQAVSGFYRFTRRLV